MSPLRRPLPSRWMGGSCLAAVFMLALAGCGDSGDPCAGEGCGTPPESPAPSSTPMPSSDQDGDGFTATGDAEHPTDCNDADAEIHPGAAETCNGIDDDCDLLIDEELETVISYVDLDDDSYGSTDECSPGCDVPEGCAVDDTDCNDDDADIHPEALESCNSIDDDCDGVSDTGIVVVWYFDGDGDGFGVDEPTLEDCEQPAGYAAVSGDCDDAQPASHPAAPEICDDLDNDCDSSVDEGVGCWDFATWDDDVWGE